MLATTCELQASAAVVHPLLCKLVLHLAARYQSVVDCSADHTVITNILLWLISVVRKSNVAAVCLCQQVTRAGYIIVWTRKFSRLQQLKLCGSCVNRHHSASHSIIHIMARLRTHSNLILKLAGTAWGTNADAPHISRGILLSMWSRFCYMWLMDAQLYSSMHLWSDAWSCRVEHPRVTLKYLTHLGTMATSLSQHSYSSPTP